MIKHLLKSTFAMIIMALSVQVHAQNVIHVDVAATGNSDGSSWVNAYNSLHTALSIADTTLTVDTILIAGGTYTPEADLPGYADGRSKSFTLKRNNLAIIGSYDASTGNRDLQNSPTILSAETGDTNIVTDNYRIIFYISGTSVDTIGNILLDGLNFEKGYNDFPYGAYSFNGISQGRNQSGSAIFARMAKVQVNNCQFINNQTIWVGGAVSLFNASMDIANSTFTNNKSYFGGALTSIESGGPLNIDNCVFSENACYQYGDAIYYEISSNYECNITNSTFKNHTTNQSIIFGDAIVHLSGNKMFNNHKSTSLISLNNYYTTNDVFIENNEIYNNTSGTTLLEINYYANTHFNNNIVARNSGYSIFGNNNYGFLIQNSTIADNNLSYLYTGTQALKNSIVSGNTMNNPLNYANMNFSYSYIQGYNDTLNNNINATLVEPMFNTLDTAYTTLNYSLQFCSPLLNVGDTTGIIWSTDVLGNTRLIGAGIDLGAIEKQSDVTAGNYINNATLTAATNNNIALMPTCDDGDWTYYTTLNNVDSIVLSINWGLNNELAKANANVYIYVDSTFTMNANGVDTAVASMKRFWHVDLGNDTLGNDVSLRLFYSAADTQEIIAALTAENYNTISSQWFTTPVSFDPATQVGATTINNGLFTAYAATNGVVNNLPYVEIAGVNGNISGGLFFKGINEDISVKNIADIDIYVSPNPATNTIRLHNLPTKVIGKQATIVDIYGRIIQTIQLTEQTAINIEKLLAGMYQINVNGSGVVKFIKM